MTHAIYYYSVVKIINSMYKLSYPDKPHEFPMRLSCLAIVF